MISTINPRFSSLAVLLLLAVGSCCNGYQLLPNQRPKAAFFAPSQRTLANSCPKLSVGADFDSDIEAALGQARVSEYERDAEFYRKRNEVYYNSIHKAEEEVEVAQLSFSDTANAAHHQVSSNDDTEHWVTDSIVTSIKASQSSFQYVEKKTFSLLKGKPMLALAMFAAAGIMVAYLSGFFFLEGYIENWNPVENDIVPYWNDAEIHTIERALPSEV